MGTPYTKDNPLLLIAGNYSEAVAFAKEQGINAPDGTFRYISEPNKLMGLRGATVYMVGTWQDRSDRFLGAIQGVAEMNDITLKTPDIIT